METMASVLASCTNVGIHGYLLARTCSSYGSSPFADLTMGCLCAERKEYDVICSQLLQYLPAPVTHTVDPPIADISAIALRGNDSPVLGGHENAHNNGYKSRANQTKPSRRTEEVRTGASPTSDVREGRARSPESRVGSPPETVEQTPGDDDAIEEDQDVSPEARMRTESVQMAIDAF
jgi:hypothetical protein